MIRLSRKRKGKCFKYVALRKWFACENKRLVSKHIFTNSNGYLAQSNFTNNLAYLLDIRTIFI